MVRIGLDGLGEVMLESDDVPMSCEHVAEKGRNRIPLLEVAEETIKEFADLERDEDVEMAGADEPEDELPEGAAP